MVWKKERAGIPWKIKGNRLEWWRLLEIGDVGVCAFEGARLVVFGCDKS